MSSTAADEQLPTRTADVTLGRGLPAAYAVMVATLVVGGLVFVLVEHQVGRLDEWVERIFELDAEESAATWVSTTQILATGLVALTLSARSERHRRAWRLIGATVVVFSVEEVMDLHGLLGEWIGANSRLSGSFDLLWFAALGAGALALAIVVVPLLRALPQRVAVQLIGATGLFMVGAVGVDRLLERWIHFGSELDSASVELGLWAEESLELVGGLLALHALMRYAGGLHVTATRPDVA